LTKDALHPPDVYTLRKESECNVTCGVGYTLKMPGSDTVDPSDADTMKKMYRELIQYWGPNDPYYRTD
jgi:hypothetical protein